ncbi:MAG TPA: hypothetical protein VK737_00240 [Opitutales bacterium]|nr:hypothetical protein [Opitutales bacterium]
MEIELFWKRSSYYWVFVGAALVAYGVIKNSIHNGGLLIASFGLISSVTWMLGNYGSKWWIENWEEKLNCEGKGILDNLFDPHEGSFSSGRFTIKRYSVTKLAILLSMFVSILWTGILIREILNQFPSLPPTLSNLSLFAWPTLVILVVVFLILMITFGIGKNRDFSVTISNIMNEKEQQEWLNKHIPHRVCACLSDSKQGSQILAEKSDSEKVHHIDLFTKTAAFEGRLAAIRWLIEFVGISEAGGKAKRPRRQSTDAYILKINGGKEIELDSKNAKILARVWKGCSQASSHPTFGSEHPPVGKDELSEALQIILEHLDSTIYEGKSKKVIESSLDQ